MISVIIAQQSHRQIERKKKSDNIVAIDSVFIISIAFVQSHPEFCANYKLDF